MCIETMLLQTINIFSVPHHQKNFFKYYILPSVFKCELQIYETNLKHAPPSNVANRIFLNKQIKANY